MDSTPIEDNPAGALLSRAHSPDAASRILADKVLKKPLILLPTQPDTTNARGLRQRDRLRRAERLRRSQKPKPLSARQKRALGIYDIPAAQRKYDIYVPLHGMWCGYIREILGLRQDGDGDAAGHVQYVTKEAAGAKLASADFHGAELEVVRSRCVGRVGTKGIVVRDTKFTFEIITKGDRIKTIPKEHTIFSFELPLADGARGLVFELHGSRFENRAPDRVNKKFKAHTSADL
ncbi:RNase P/MRP, p29 subunit [Saccharata proteae CBS 121410]|uniref:Ribonuclease P protein subunit n=1 Tax=Saccharata proteae CBS 121410 TaxID=1314787 RepID=A0A9P4HRU2_9PEZI|nr:RNase P/MRP, p29 subunit [Saccharata proteae CBS 121410]